MATRSDRVGGGACCGYCYEDDLPEALELTADLYEASFVDGVRLYPWHAVARAACDQLASLKSSMDGGVVAHAKAKAYLELARKRAAEADLAELALARACGNELRVDADAVDGDKRPEV